VYSRLRIGVGPHEELKSFGGNLADYVLSPFGKMDRQEILALMPKFTDACEQWIREGIHKTMNAHNSN
jgi:peptidyl-tRNA hydrolase